MAKNVIQDSTLLPPVAIRKHVDSDKEQCAIRKMTHVVPINAKLLHLVLSAEQPVIRLAISKKRVMEPARIARKIRGRMMVLIVGMDYNVPVGSVRV
jgi:hypothetical protein